MIKQIFQLLFFLFVSYIQIYGQNQVIVNDGDINEGETINWTNDNVYLLDGYVFVEAGAVLTIDPGTVIKGAASPSTGDIASALIITRGAQIFAEGTREAPIIFYCSI